MYFIRIQKFLLNLSEEQLRQFMFWFHDFKYELIITKYAIFPCDIFCGLRNKLNYFRLALL